MIFLTALLASALLTNCADVASAICTRQIGVRFAVEGQVIVSPNNGDPTLSMSDDSGGVQIMGLRNVPGGGTIRSGDIVRATGRIHCRSNSVVTSAACDGFAVVGHRSLPPPIEVSPQELQSGRFDCQPVSIRGTIREIIRDEVDPSNIFLSLSCGDETIYVSVNANTDSETKIKTLPEAEIVIRGVCVPGLSVSRWTLGRFVSIRDLSAVEILKAAPPDPFAAPLIQNEVRRTPSQIARLGRTRVIGLVTAVRSTHEFLVLDKTDVTRSIRLAKPPCPRYGDRVEIVGSPETDLYRINLTDAIWRPSADTSIVQSKPTDVRAADILTDGNGNPRINPAYHGRAIRISGIVMDVPVSSSGQGTLFVKSGGFTVPVNIGTNRGILDTVSVGCEVSVAGTCIIETETWRPFATFPHTTGMTLVVRTPDDVRVLARPSWWTSQRLTATIGALLLVLSVILVWNRLLTRLVDRKSRELANSRLAQLGARLRVRERTRLAVELHDSLSQNLTGVTFQLDASLKARKTNPEAAERHLRTAMSTLSSCRIELGRCLWDLRSAALDEPDFDEAIRKVLQPIIHDARVSIRFLIPRKLLGDATAHAVLRIIRELVANALRHGHATGIRVAGDISTGALKFSVADDGCGFDPDNSPGPREGHFGLAGILERIKGLKGTVEIASVPGKGTKVTVNIPTPKDDTPDEDHTDEKD